MPDLFKRTTLLDPFQSVEVQLYFPAAAISEKTATELPKATACLNLIMQYVDGAIIQHSRLQQEQQALNRFAIENSAARFGRQADWDAWFIRLQSFFLDIHYYAICVDKIEKLYSDVLGLMAPLSRNAPNNAEIRKKRNIAQNRLREVIHPIVEARQYLEHIDKEIAKGNYAGLRTQYNDLGIILTYGDGEKQVTMDMGNINNLRQAYEDLVDYVVSLPRE
jgi:hypothetical protein